MTADRRHLELVTQRGAWEAVVAGEARALEELFSEWLPVILQWCRRLGGSRVDPDQAAQEVALVVLARVHTVRSREALPSWIFTVTRRVLANHRRRRWGIRWDTGAEVDRSASPDSPELTLERARRIDTVREILDSLPPNLREAVVLCDVEGRQQTEVAELVGVPLGTVKSRLRRGRQAFERIARSRGLGPNPDDAGDSHES